MCQKAEVEDAAQVRPGGEVKKLHNAPGYNLLSDTITITHPDGLNAALSSLFGFLHLRQTVRMTGRNIAAMVTKDHSRSQGAVQT